VVAAAVAAIVTAANASQGAYFSQSWGWVALAFLVPTTVLLILDRVDAPGRLRIAFAGLMVALAAWIALSAIWSISTPGTFREVERALVYVAVALAVALVLRRGDVGGVVLGIVVGVGLICTYALATRLFQDRFDTYDDRIDAYRLAAPLGYWNSLGLLASIGIITALGLLAHSRRTAPALVAAGIVPVAATTLYFTFSRGAWLSLAIGFVAATATDPRRLRFLWTSFAVAVPSAACIAYASTFASLTEPGSARAAAIRDGHRVAAVVGAVVAGSVVAGMLARLVARRVPLSAKLRTRTNVALAAAVAVLAAGSLVAIGGPAAAADSLRNRFDAEPSAGSDLNDRLFSISGNGRAEQLRVAWDAGRERPILGQGSGTFEYLWYERRPTDLVVRDGHSLYAETFAELGVVGIVLLLSALVLPLVAALRARRGRLVAAAIGAFVAWCAAASVDWHWEMVAVTMTALLAGCAALLADERRPPGRLPSVGRSGLIAATVILSVAATWSLVGNQALFGGREAASRKDWVEAREHARRARALLFWSAEPDLVLGDAAAGLGDRAEALRNYRAAADADPRSWVAWLRVAQVARGAERSDAYRRVRELNPREGGLPGT
jgi:O-Antigen ligase